MKVLPAASVSGVIQLPGDKSISHRAAMLASIAAGVTRIENYAASADCSSTLACMSALGVGVKREDSQIVIAGVGKRGLKAPDLPLDCGNSGTTMRLLSGILAGQEFETILSGDESLSSRPMERVIDPLTIMGAAIAANDGHAPLRIKGKNSLRAVVYEPPVASAQIKSCVLLAGLYAAGTTSVIEGTPTRDHTERMLRWFGVDVDVIQSAKGTTITVDGTAELTARDLSVPGDISAAAFFIAAAACLDASEITMPNVGLNSSRCAILDVMRSLGANVTLSDTNDRSNEPVGTIRVVGAPLATLRRTPMIRGKTIANLIDEVPILAIFGTQLATGLEIRDAAELRVKESDRISTVVENLRRMGASVTEFDDGFRVERSLLTGAVIDSRGDHRIAMAFAIAGLLAKGETEVIGAECAAVSFPAFFETLSSVVRYTC
ncbi:MAG: 3-phosphoshikimate 1-carboxyvinyltransferase [Pyrinomonadaceae bacterium]